MGGGGGGGGGKELLPFIPNNFAHPNLLYAGCSLDDQDYIMACTEVYFCLSWKLS